MFRYIFLTYHEKSLFFFARFARKTFTEFIGANLRRKFYELSLSFTNITRDGGPFLGGLLLCDAEAMLEDGLMGVGGGGGGNSNVHTVSTIAS